MKPLCGKYPTILMSTAAVFVMFKSCSTRFAVSSVPSL